MENDTFARKLEKDFSLPWHLQRVGEDFSLPWHLQRVGEASEIITASGNPLFYIKCGKTEQDWNACEYLVHCANLMPEAVELLGKCAIEMQKRCDCCAGKGGRACIGCSNSEMRTEIHALLAKAGRRRNRMSDFELLQRIIASRFYIENSDEVKPEDNFKHDLMSDWLGMIELIEDVENEFSISIPDVEFGKIKTVSDLMQCIERAKGGAEDERD